MQLACLLSPCLKYGNRYAGGDISAILVHQMSIPNLSSLQITCPDLVLTIFFIGLGPLLVVLLGTSPTAMQSDWFSHTLCLLLASTFCLMGDTLTFLPFSVQWFLPMCYTLFVACCMWFGHSNLLEL